MTDRGTPAFEAPADGLLKDRFGRVFTDLRISVTEQCNLRCRYCMPEEGAPAAPKDRLLAAGEIVRVARLMTGLSVRKIRLTGGEPLLRRDLVEITAGIGRLPGLRTLALTTNGLKLRPRARDLQAAGLHRVTVSLDTLDPTKFADLTRGGRLSDVVDGIRAARDAGLGVKVNAVTMKGVNEADLPGFVEFAAATGVVVRFIEFMPFGGNEWSQGRLLPGAEARRIIGARYRIRSLGRPEPSSPSEEYDVEDPPARIGFISSVTESFCTACTRMRLTAEGGLRPCLHADTELDLRGPMRGGVGDDELLGLIREAARQKGPGHDDWQAGGGATMITRRPMVRIGG
jgi:cyclic pyranopterin phosphate synthase